MPGVSTSGDQDGAIDTLNRAAAVVDDDALPNYLAAGVFVRAGRLDEAREVIEGLEGLSELIKLGDLAELAAREGRPEEALRISQLADSIPRRPGQGPVPDVMHRAHIALAAGDRERAMGFLRELAGQCHRLVALFEKGDHVGGQLAAAGLSQVDDLLPTHCAQAGFVSG